MKTLEDYIRSIHSEKYLSDKFDFTSNVHDVLKKQSAWNDNFSGLNILSAISKGIHSNAIFNKQNSAIINALSKSMSLNHRFKLPYSAVEELSKSLALHNKIAIPNTAFEAIQSIHRQHEHFFSNLQFVDNSSHTQNSTFSQINNLRSALSGISGKLGLIAASQNNWSLLDDFENISEQALEISESITTEFTFSEEESKRFEKLIEFIMTFIKNNKNFGTNALLFLSVIVNIMAIHQYYDFIKEKPAQATKEDLMKFETRIMQTIAEKLKEQNEYRITNRLCKVFIKPTNRTLVIESIPEDFEVVCLQTKHKWVYISYISNKDNLPKTGWVLKKYLNKP